MHFALLNNTDTAVTIGNETKYTLFNQFEFKFATLKMMV